MNQFPASAVLKDSLFNVKLQQTRRCPGGNIARAPDGSNPWVPDRSLCDPSQTPPSSVNEP